MEGEMKVIHIDSEYLQERVQVKLYIPPNYNDLYTYHLAITQDGQDYFHLGKIGRKMEEFILEENGEETIVAGIVYPSVNVRRAWLHPDSNQHSSYLHFLVRELLPILEERFHTYELPFGRTLIGDSLGATTALNACIRYPSCFARAILQSPYVNASFLEAVKHAEKLSSADLYHSIGLQETRVHTTDQRILDFLSPNRELNQILQTQVENYTYKELEGDHTWVSWEPDLKHALWYMFQ
ncbi:alpha/beta hydrolase [Salsuginibacillus kocurii]|uniref:alpha/beta hydrolase n=1 Tax=Salsuginibacillus kocurii TaxID=427078 RepID=UPI00037A741F|nr:alpha/beta hydrolase-fold protein [Salsuginibacillus kocurii]